MKRKQSSNGAPAVHCAHSKIIPIAKLKEHPGNPNTHPPEQIALLAHIIANQGWRNPIVVSKRSGLITKGHARLYAAKALNLTTVPVDYQPYASEKQELADMVADNRIAELAELDRGSLRDIMEQLDDGAFDMDLTGFDQVALEELMTATAPESDVDAEPQIDKADELRKKWGVERGQIWELGEHRLMCGNATNENDHRKLLDGQAVNLVLTDPPYGVGIAYGSNSSSSDSKNLVAQIVLNALPLLRQWSVVLITPGQSNLHLYPVPTWRLAWFEPAGVGRSAWGFTCWQIVLAYGADPYLSNGKGSRPDAWVGIGEGPSSEDHPVSKPLKIWTWLLERGSANQLDVVMDVFSGSGTTLIACEQLGRKCRAMEIDPGYVAVSLQRFLDATGKTPKLVSNG